MNTNRLMLIIAIAAGVMATVLAFQYISSATSAMEENQAEPQVPIIFTIKDLPADHSIDPGVDLRIEEIGSVTSAALVRTAVKSDELQALRGQRVYHPVPAGMPLLYSHLAPIQDLELGPGMRAIAIEVDESSMFGGILVPGDRVDIIVSYRVSDPLPVNSGQSFDAEDPLAAVSQVMDRMMSQGASEPHQWVAEQVLSAIRVVAIGDRLNRSRQQFPFGVAPRARASNVITLEVTPDQALLLIQSTAGGSNPLKLLLLPPATGAGAAGAALLEEG